MYDERAKRLADFTAWVKQHITGDERGEAQIFLDRLMQAFGQRGLSLDEKAHSIRTMTARRSLILGNPPAPGYAPHKESPL